MLLKLARYSALADLCLYVFINNVVEVEGKHKVILNTRAKKYF